MKREMCRYKCKCEIKQTIELGFPKGKDIIDEIERYAELIVHQFKNYSSPKVECECKEEECWEEKEK